MSRHQRLPTVSALSMRSLAGVLPMSRAPRMLEIRK